MNNVKNNLNNEAQISQDSSYLLKFFHARAFKGEEGCSPQKVPPFNPNLENNPLDKIKIGGNEEVNNVFSSNEYQEFINETLRVLKLLGEQLKLSEIQLADLTKGYQEFLELFFKEREEQEIVQKNLLYEKIKNVLGSDFKNKELLIKKATSWLGITSLNSPEEYLRFLDKMSWLGKIISEDEDIKNEQSSYALTKQEALKERNNLITDEKFKFALTNKMHPLHKDALNKLRQLNSIIVS